MEKETKAGQQKNSQEIWNQIEKKIFNKKWRWPTLLRVFYWRLVLSTQPSLSGRSTPPQSHTHHLGGNQTSLANKTTRKEHVVLLLFVDGFWGSLTFERSLRWCDRDEVAMTAAGPRRVQSNDVHSRNWATSIIVDVSRLFLFLFLYLDLSAWLPSTRSNYPEVKADGFLLFCCFQDIRPSTWWICPY